MSVAALIADLIRAGLDPDLVGRTAAALAERGHAGDQQAERRRAKDRERKRLRNSAESAENVAPQEIYTQPPTSSSEANASAPAAEPTDPVERVWKIGVRLLVELGIPERQAKSNIGRWMRDTQNDAGRVLAAIQRARDHSTGDPIALVSRILSPINGPRNGQRSNRPSKADQQLAVMGEFFCGLDEPGLPAEDPGGPIIDHDPAWRGSEPHRGLRPIDGGRDTARDWRDRDAPSRRLSG